MAKPCTPRPITRKGYATSVRQQSCQRLCNAQRVQLFELQTANGRGQGAGPLAFSWGSKGDILSRERISPLVSRRARRSPSRAYAGKGAALSGYPSLRAARGKHLRPCGRKKRSTLWGALRKEGAPGRLLYLSLISSWKRCNHCGYAVFSLLRSARCCWKASSISSGINSWSMPTPL